MLFTGRWPEGLRSFMVASLRVLSRLNAYSHHLTDQYPPFALD